MGHYSSALPAALSQYVPEGKDVKNCTLFPLFYSPLQQCFRASFSPISLLSTGSEPFTGPLGVTLGLNLEKRHK